MSYLRLVLSIVALVTSSSGAAAECDKPNLDWPNLGAYRAANANLSNEKSDEVRIVFMGDSITEFWDKSRVGLFANPALINRGISGQTTPQMLLRFRQDVVDLKPRAVVILAGTNDIAGNTGPATIEMIAGNIASMAEIAQVHGIKVVLSAVLPAAGFYWAPEQRPAARIADLNAALRELAAQRSYVFVDYHSAMKTSDLGLRKEFSDDGVHPNAAGYLVMTRLITQVLQNLSTSFAAVKIK